ncbi:hypothetical protein H4R18_005811 [Coemansia javaensis]|uniref:Tetratricopeptide SHNi-TPR domain-containing protein n=1 Tax=Coemansia javaensis TaxID=2761396 RepID=A0A9W8H576_9FUNG|nr:hypothetical protein H4R18_005811 [Coemansia javaensis]
MTTDKGKQADSAAAGDESQSAFNAVLPVIADLLERGTRAFALSEWETAIAHFGELASITEEAFGSESQRYADALVMYGRALLQHAIEQSALLAQKTLAEAASGAAKPGAKEDEGEEEAAPSKANINFEGEPDFRQIEQPDGASSSSAATAAAAAGQDEDNKDKNGNEDDNGDDDDDEQDDFAAAWNVLDLARVIQEKATDEKARLKYAETLVLLGDVSMESENFAQAVRDFGAALEVKRQHLGDDSRELAEMYYKVALAHEYNQESARALELMPNVQRILGNRLRALEPSTDAADRDEAAALREVLDEVADKIEEWKAPQRPAGLGAASPDEAALAERAKEMFKRALEAGEIRDISDLVRPKPKAAGDKRGADAPEQDEAKRARAGSDGEPAPSTSTPI